MFLTSGKILAVAALFLSATHARPEGNTATIPSKTKTNMDHVSTTVTPASVTLQWEPTLPPIEESVTLSALGLTTPSGASGTLAWAPTLSPIVEESVPPSAPATTTATPKSSAARSFGGGVTLAVGMGVVVAAFL